MMSSVSRTLWSVISTPMPRSFRWRTSVADVADGDRVDAGERLVEQHEGGVGGKRAGDLDAAPLAARERALRARSLSRVMREFLEQGVELKLALPLVRLDQSRARRRIFSSTVRPRKIEASCGR